VSRRSGACSTGGSAVDARGCCTICVLTSWTVDQTAGVVKVIRDTQNRLALGAHNCCGALRTLAGTVEANTVGSIPPDPTTRSTSASNWIVLARTTGEAVVSSRTVASGATALARVAGLGVGVTVFGSRTVREAGVAVEEESEAVDRETTGCAVGRRPLTLQTVHVALIANLAARGGILSVGTGRQAGAQAICQVLPRHAADAVIRVGTTAALASGLATRAAARSRTILSASSSRIGASRHAGAAVEIVGDSRHCLAGRANDRTAHGASRTSNRANRAKSRSRISIIACSTAGSALAGADLPEVAAGTKKTVYTRHRTSITSTSAAAANIAPQ
jgi:hypothetical protein